jgi:hypothetical protein
MMAGAEQMHLDVHARQVLRRGNNLLALEKRRFSSYATDFKNEAQSFDIPYPAKSGLVLPGQDLSLAYMTERGDVVLASQASMNVTPSAAITLVPSQAKELSLFQDIFSTLKVETEPSAPLSTIGVSTVFDQPAHLIPPMQLVWREALLLPADVQSIDSPQAQQAVPMDLDPVPETVPAAKYELPVRTGLEYGQIIAAAFGSQMPKKG